MKLIELVLTKLEQCKAWSVLTNYTMHMHNRLCVVMAPACWPSAAVTRLCIHIFKLETTIMQL